MDVSDRVQVGALAPTERLVTIVRQQVLVEAIAKLTEAIRDPQPTSEGKTVWGRTHGAARGARRGENVV